MNISKLYLSLSLATVTVISLGSGVSAATIDILASDAYYTFRGSVSINSGIRLLVDKATTIGLGPQDTFSFLKFDQDDLPTSVDLGNKNFRALLNLQYDPSLASTLIPASSSRPLSVSIYNLTAPFDDINGNIPDINYGTNGANAIDTTLVRDPGIYSWNITSLVKNWIASPATNNGLALSGLFGNVDTDGRNSYGIFYTVGTTNGLVPTISIIPVPEPASGLAILVLGIWGISVARKHKQC